MTQDEHLGEISGFHGIWWPEKSPRDLEQDDSTRHEPTLADALALDGA